MAQKNGRAEASVANTLVRVFHSNFYASLEPKDCSGGSAGSLTWSCNCKDKSQVYRGTSTVLKWTCQKGTGTTEDGLPDPESTELTNIDGCLQCATYNDAWGDAKLVVGIEDVCIAASPDYIASLFKND